MVEHVKKVQGEAQAKSNAAEEKKEKDDSFVPASSLVGMPVSRFPEAEQKILKALHQAGGALDSRGLYDALGITTENDERVCRGTVGRLESTGVVKTEDAQKGKGHTRIIRLEKKIAF